jgi:hypothetical protein
MTAVSMLEDVSIEGSRPGDGWSPPRHQRLFLVTGRPVPDSSVGAGDSGRTAAAQPRTVIAAGSGRGPTAPSRPDSATRSARGPDAQNRPAVAGAGPIRLTRRGRAVVTALALMVATVGVTVGSLAAAGGAQAANHGRPGAGYAGLRQIVVQPGQTLWSIAAQAEPSADPRLVVAEIMTANAMSNTVIEAGQLLWVPR